MSDFKKGSPQFEFFADFYKYAAKYFTPGPTIAWWDGMVHDANDIVRKYEATDLKTGMMARALMCGFFSGKKELLNWEASDLFQFYYDTTAVKGSLDDLLVLIDQTTIDRAIKMGACNIYHGCVHNMLHEKSKDILKKRRFAADDCSPI